MLHEFANVSPALIGLQKVLSRVEVYDVWSCCPSGCPPHWSAGGTSAVLTVAPVIQHQGLKVAVIGLVNMLNSGGAILGCKLQSVTGTTSTDQSRLRSGNGSSRSTECKLDLVIKGHGTLMLYCNDRPQSVSADLGGFPFDYDSATGRLTVSLTGEHLQQQVVLRW
jgi:hypothetical protein